MMAYQKTRWHRVAESELDHTLEKLEETPKLIEESESDRAFERLTQIQIARELRLAILLTAVAVFELIDTQEDH